jgi:hypothetical protein
MKRLFRSSILTLVLAIILSVASFTTSASAANKSDVYAAYYDVLNTRIEEIGIIKPSTVKAYDGMAFPDGVGVYYAHVVDMDNDGVSELFVIESRTDYEVINGSLTIDNDLLYLTLYTYKNGKAVKLLDEKMGFGASWGFCRSSSGQTYFYAKTYEDRNIYYSVSNGQLKTRTAAIGWVYDFSASGSVNGTHVWVHSDTVHASSYYIDGKAVSRAEYNRQVQALEKTTLIKHTFYTEKAPDSKVTDTINEIATQTPASFIQGYRTPSDWAATGVKAGISMGIVPNYLQKMYNQPITRAEFCELAAKYYEISTGKTITTLADFNDTTSEAVRKMGGLGIITGTGGGNFSPDT